MAQWSSQTQRQGQRLSQGQWSKSVTRHQSSGGTRRASLSGGNGRRVGLQMLWGTLLPRKDPELGEEESPEDDGGPDEEEEEPQFLDAEEMSGGGAFLKSAYCRRRTVIIDDQICQKKFEVTGRFPLLGPWWEVRVYVKRVHSMYYMKGFPSYFLRTDFGSKKDGLLSLFLKECDVPEEFKEKFFKWLPQKLLLTFHNLEVVLQEFSDTMDPEKGGYNILKYVQTSCTGVNVNNALAFPLIMEYVPILLPRLFKNLLKWERKRRNDNDEETKEAENGLFSHVHVLTKIEDMLNKDPWKLGFGRITCRELRLLRCEVSLKAFLQCEPLLQKIPELQLNALIIYDHLKQRCNEFGDTYVERDILTKDACQDMSVVQAWEALEFLKEEDIVVREKDRIFLPNLYFYEVKIATCIEALMNKDPWHLNVDVEEVLRAQQTRPVKDAGTDDTLEELSSQLYEMEPQEPDLRTGEVLNVFSDFQNSGKETEGEGSPLLEVDPDQVRAAEMICSNPLTVISGKGGCGKTTVVSLIFKHLLSKESDEVEKACRAFESDLDASDEWFTQSQPVQKETRDLVDGMSVLLTAPTGKAASLLKKKTNLPSFTLHQITASYYHWLQSGTENKWKFSKVEVLVVDEGSLVSVQILSSVLVLLCEHAKLGKLVLLGDVRQLPSIDPGNMLADVFQSVKNIHWAIELRTNHRAESQLIVDNATRISEQKFVQFDAVVEIGKRSHVTMPSSENKFILVSLPEDGNDDDLQTAVKLLLEKGPGLQDDKTSQFIAFRRVDCDLINELCCQHYSGHSTINRKHKPLFQCQDKVCCTKNAYIKDLVPSAKSDRAVKDRALIHGEGNAPHTMGERDPMNGETTGEKTDLESMENKEERLCNGEIFFITDDVEKDKVRCLTISDMDEREYTLDYLKLYRICNIKHAWARTIHTFQGSEEGTIVYVVGTAGRQDWQHVYTAVTRGRQRVYIVAKEDQLVKAVFNKCRPRKTRLRQRLKEKLAQRNDCAAPTSSQPLQLSQESTDPCSPMMSNQEEDIILLNSQETNGEKDVAIGSKALCVQNDISSSVIMYDELTDSDLEGAFQTTEKKQVSNAIQFPQKPLLERQDITGPKLPLQQQEHESCGASFDIPAGGGFASVTGPGEWDRNSTGAGSTADSFGELNDSELETLLRSPLCEAPYDGDSLVATSGIKRLPTEEEVAESPSKISRVTLDKSPLGCTRFRDLSLTTACQKQLF